MKSLIPFLALLPLLYGCIDCGPQAEPDISIFINDFVKGDSLKLNKVRAIGALSQELFHKNIDTTTSRSWSFSFPVSLHSDSTAFIFEFETRTDTLTVFYQRKFYHKDQCGFVVDLAEPKNKITNKSTFSRVSVSYSSYIGVNSFTSSTAGGTLVNVTL